MSNITEGLMEDNIDLYLPAGSQEDLEAALTDMMIHRAEDITFASPNQWGESRVLQGDDLHVVQWSYVGLEQKYDQDKEQFLDEYYWEDGQPDFQIDCSWLEIKNFSGEIMKLTKKEIEDYLSACKKIYSYVNDTFVDGNLDVVKCYGICFNVKYLLPEYGDTVYATLKYLFSDWPKHSGDSDFPVAGIFEYEENNDLWEDYEGGNLRKELLDFTIAKLEKMYHETE